MAGGNFGKTLLCRMHTQGCDDELVIVKKVANGLVDATRCPGRVPGCSDPLNEIGVLLKLAANPKRGQFLVELIDLARNDAHTMIVMKNCNGGALFNTLCCEEASEKVKLKRHLWQLLQATSHLHSNNIGHQNISLEALLVHDGDLRLSDFGQAMKLASSEEECRSGRYLRHHHLCGSGYYRAPECFVEMATSGYEAPAVDIFACGVVFLVLQARCPPWRCALPCDRHFARFCEHGADELRSARHLTEDAVALLLGMLHPEPSTRISPDVALSSPWFDDL